MAACWCCIVLTSTPTAHTWDVLTISIYRYARFGTCEEIKDHTMTLKLRRGDKTRTYPLAKEPLDFGLSACGVARAHEFIPQAAEPMAATLSAVQHDERIPKGLITNIQEAWGHGFALAREIASLPKPGSS